MSAPRVTVAVVVKDRREQMLRCLEALLALEFDSYEVLVLDNGSSDGTPEAVAARAARASVEVRVERVEGSLGRARNAAGERARGDLLAFTDSDCMPTPGWLAAGVAPFDDSPRLGIVQGPTLPEPGVDFRPWTVTQEIPAFSGRYECCNLVLRRAALTASEGFDEQGNFGEDTAGGYAILRAGWTAAFAPEALVHHDLTFPGYRWWLRQAGRYGSLARVIARYPEMRDDLLYRRYFLRPRTPKVLAAAAGLALAPRRPWAALAAVPYVVDVAPRRRNLAAAAYATGQTAAFDLLTVAGNVRGSIRHRTLLI